jgi:hypothetical protein
MWPTPHQYILQCTSHDRFGQKQTYAVQHGMSRFTPNSDRESEIPQTVMSAFPRQRTFLTAIDRELLT